MHKVFKLLDLNREALKSVFSFVENGEESRALEELLLYYRERSSVAGFLSIPKFGRENLKKQAQKMPTEEKDYLSRVVSELEKKQFLFKEPWDMERTQEPYTFEGSIGWLTVPKGDPEWMYMLNRQNYLNVLAQAYLLTEKASIGKTYCMLIQDWLSSHSDPRLYKHSSCRTIDTGIRLRNWMKSLELMIHYPDFPPRLLADILVTIVQHLEYLQENWYLGRFQTNWIILETNGAFLTATYFEELKISSEIRDQSLEIITNCGHMQMTEEGMHWEQSFQYHNEVLLKLAEVYLICQRNQHPIPLKLKKVVEKMSTVTAQICKPNFYQSNFGDSDRESLIGILLFLEQVLNRSLINLEARIHVNRFVLFHFGKDLFLFNYKTSKFQTSIALEESGIYILKDKVNQVHAMFTCGPLGHGHGHDNLLHFELFAHGEDILIDSGRYNYEQEIHKRLSYKESKAHNTVVVDDKPYQTHLDPWTTATVAQPINAKSVFSEQVDFVEGGHLGYLTLHNSVYLNRKVIFVKPDLIIVADEFLGKGKHKFQQLFHFEQQRVSLLSDRLLNYRLLNGRDIQLQVEPSEDTGKWQLEEVYVSEDYNERHLTTRADFTAIMAAPGSIVTFIQLGEKKRKIKRLPVYHEYGMLRENQIVSAFDLDNGQRILINHLEDQDSRRAYLVDGQHIYGRVVLWDGIGNQIKLK